MFELEGCLCGCVGYVFVKKEGKRAGKGKVLKTVEGQRLGKCRVFSKASGPAVLLGRGLR